MVMYYYTIGGGGGDSSSFLAFWKDVKVMDRRLVTFSRGFAWRVAAGIPTSMSSTLRRGGLNDELVSLLLRHTYTTHLRKSHTFQIQDTR